MSGHKMATVTISQDEYRKLYEAERKLRYSFHDLPYAVTERRIDENQSIFDQLISFNQNRIYDYENSIPLNVRDSDDDAENLKKLYDFQISNLQDIIEKQNLRIKDHESIGSKDVHSHSEQISILRDQIDALNSHLTEQINIKKESEIPLQEFVLDLLFQLETYLYSLSRHSNHTLFPKDQFGKLAVTRDTIAANISDGYYEASLSLVQITLLDAKELIRKFDLDRSLLFYLTTKLSHRFREIEDLILHNHLTEAVSIEGKRTGIFLDLNEWSDGKFHALLIDIENLRTWWDENMNVIDFEEFKKFEDYLGLVEDNYQDAIITAHTNAINSQLKYEIANQVLLALITQGYIPSEGNFVENEGEERYFASAQNAEGSTVTILVDKAGEGFIGSKLSIISSDYEQRTEYELSRRASEIKEAISKYGLEINDLIEVQEKKDMVMTQGKEKEITKMIKDRKSVV